MRILLLLLLCLAGLAQAAQPFHAPAVPSGSLTVRLHPTEVVTPGTPVLVTFGLPLPRGSLTPAQLATVRVLKDGVEQPAHVSLLTPWRHRSNASIDGASVRVARVQIRHSFAATFPASETITLSWGGPPRTLDVPALADARSAWHRVASGSFIAADNVFEPDVYAVLPGSWLAQGLLKSSRSTPFDASNGEARDDPATMDGIASWPGTQEAERALKNNFYNVINRDDPLVTPANQCPYKTDREPWLYDRGGTMFILYFRSGFFSALREAVQATQFYADRLDAQGFFTLAAGDSKYAYNESLAYTLWTVADPLAEAKIGLVPGAHTGFPHAWTPQRNFWTERHAAYKLLANVVAYEVLGGSARRDAVEQILADYRAHQDGANGAIPAQRIDGGLYHTGDQHAGDWGSTDLGGSSWMTGLLLDAAVRAYATGEDVATANFVRRLGTFLAATLEQASDTDYGGTLWQPRYAMLLDGTSGQRNGTDIEHSLNVAGALAWSAYFAEATGQSPTAFRTAAQNLYASYDIGVNYWIRPAGPASGLPAFRVSPWRKWGWEHRTSDGYAFALAPASGTQDEPGLSGFPLPAPNPPNASCPAGFFIASAEDGPGAGLTPGVFGMELLLDDPGTRRLEGGLNFGGLVDAGQPGFAGFNFANPANENQRLNLRVTGSPA
ncbi:MAG: hypothetical protein IT479_07780, partial [Xanthomonadales bacterium]|nr:hypothetical protein [Xanthomonadales bacterium]